MGPHASVRENAVEGPTRRPSARAFCDDLRHTRLHTRARVVSVRDVRLCHRRAAPLPRRSPDWSLTRFAAPLWRSGSSPSPGPGPHPGCGTDLQALDGPASGRGRVRARARDARGVEIS